MLKPDLNWLKQYLNFSRKDRNAILILAILIFLVLTGHIIVNSIQPKSKLDLAKVEQTLKVWDEMQEQELNLLMLFKFDPNTILEEKLDSLLIPESVKKNIISYRNAGGQFESREDFRKIYGVNDSIFEAVKSFIAISDEYNDQPKQKTFAEGKENITKIYKGYFDPNTIDMDSLKQFGFNNFQTGNLIKYRKNGGSFNTPDDLLKIYGIDSVFYSSIKKNIRIKKRVTKNKRSDITKIFIELNSADSARLVKLQGIGPVFASRIIKFRELLGGFYTTSQLLEVYNFPEETYLNIKNNITVDTTAIIKIRLNFAGYSELLRHPYINEKQVKNIIEFREKNGSINSVEQLIQVGLLNKKELNRLRQYLTCR